ncbi:hypothetical protein BEWA_041120 [Theileria equi strain WA]|uniref:Uncharacterized protein n=1 Tax=Theileria equi strain WA TaxID=1537102 RepID=L1LFM6_THEEQ|nr:hypothetical protein BEWA_041120 [Theileria equi strain WA]EKX74074.1 hypothetical protein BEWA_041120 [Theileria equi strain WA]|eukprot:XP_004833526.1 hypothetical protein BEWA_041120 [Theileria equi strain WA]
MDRYKRCENILTHGFEVQCNQNYLRLEDNFRDVASVSKSSSNSVPNLTGLLDKHNGLPSKIDERVINTLSRCLLHCCSFFDGNGRLDSSPIGTNGRKVGLSNVIDLLKHRNVTVFDDIACLCLFFLLDMICHLVGHLTRSQELLFNKDSSSRFNQFTDGYYELNAVPSGPPVGSQMYDSHSAGNEMIHNFLKNVRGYLKVEANSYLLKDVKSFDKVVASPASDEGEKFKNIQIQHLLGAPLMDIENLGYNYFDPYYNYNNVRQKGKELVHDRVGAMYSPLNPRLPDEGTTFRIDTGSRSLRQIYRPPKGGTEGDFSKKFGKIPVALFARNPNFSSEVVLLNDSAIRQSSSDTPAEYIVSISNTGIKIYNCALFSANIRSNPREKQNTLRKSFYINEIVRNNMLDRLTLKLLRFETARTDSATKWRSNIDAINKYLSSLSWGCLWQNWHFFRSSLVPETTFLEAVEDFDKLLSDDDGVSKLRLLCFEFISGIKSDYASGITNISDFVKNLVSNYSNTIISGFDDEFSKLRIKLANELGASTQTEPKVSKKSSANTAHQDSLEPQKVNDENVQSMRDEHLPKYFSFAKDPYELTSLDKIIDCGLLDSSDFSGEPFLSCMQDTTLITSKLRRSSKTAVNVCKICAMSLKKTDSGETSERIARCIKILDIFVVLLQKSSKQFKNSNDLNTFISTYHRVPFELSIWILGQFYVRKGNSEFILNSTGCKKLMCHLMWLCIYTCNSEWSYDFSTLLNIDFRGMMSLNLLFDSCVELTSLVQTGGKKSRSYRLEVPLVTPSSSQIGDLVSALRSNKRSRRE